MPFRVGLNSALILDYWAIELAVQDGSEPGGVPERRLPFDDRLEGVPAADGGRGQESPADRRLDTFAINLPSGGCQASMSYVGPYSKVDHVFVLDAREPLVRQRLRVVGHPRHHARDAQRLELLQRADLPGRRRPAPPSMPTDPGHEFLDVVEQLCGQVPPIPRGSPTRSRSRTPASSPTTPPPGPRSRRNNPNLPTPAEYGDIMQCFDTPTQLPVIYQLATEFAVCDQWFSSIPGPTWPNRFFVHGASSARLGGQSHGTGSIIGWETPGGGFTYPSGSSIFDALSKGGCSGVSMSTRAARPSAGSLRSRP